MKGKFKLDFNLKKEKQYTIDIAVVGDRVHFDVNDDGSGIIYEINPRFNYLSRKAPRTKGSSYRGGRLEQIIAANFDNFFAVCSVADPMFNNKSLDRLLVTAESSHYNTIIVLTKVDLDEENLIDDWVDIYTSIGYKVIKASIESGVGLEILKAEMKGKTNLLWGHSGVGKSSLLNALFPNLTLKTGDISTFNYKGKHTTVTASMHEVNPGTFVVDTPGIREIEPFGLKKEDLYHYYKEFVPFARECKFSTCTHDHEPGCAVLQAVEEELISPLRYDSYLRLLSSIEEDIIF